MDITCKIQAERLLQRLADLSKIGANAQGGIDRQLGSPADIEARSWLQQLWEQMGLDVRRDAIANLWAEDSRTRGKGKPLVLGSHHDTVPNGGAYDGALGVLMATEVLETLREHDAKLHHPLSLISFTGEEPNDFSVSTLGSKVLCGRLTEPDLMQLKHRVTGESLENAIERMGGDIHQVAAHARLTPGSLAGFIECHIEQGRRLYDVGEKVAAVSCITGIYREIITVEGEANHAGTTRYKDRRDALMAAAEVGLAVEDIIRQPEWQDVAATVGRIKVAPNASNIIPGQVELTLDLRTANPEHRQQALAYLTREIQRIAKKRRAKITQRLNLDQPEMPMSPVVIQALLDGAETIGEPRRELVSMAGHDAANMARLTKAGMLFVSTVNGYSHCPQERAEPDAIAAAAQNLLESVLLLDRRLE